MARPGYETVYLVTGFPSLYAQRVVREILWREPSALVHAVVLSKFEQRAAEARATLEVSAAARLVLVEGDASAMDLGLSGAELRERAAEVDRIHHMAFASYAGLARSRAELTNVHGAAEILEVARCCAGLRLLTFHSSVFVTGRLPGVVPDGRLPGGVLGEAPPDLAPVVTTRFAAERYVRRRGGSLPIAIVRAGHVVADSETGEVERLDGPHLLALVALLAPPELRGVLGAPGEHVHMTPLDYLARAAQALGARDESRGSTFHLLLPEPLAARTFFEGVLRAAEAAERLPANLATALLRAPGVEGFVRSPRRFLEEHLSRTRYDDAAARAVLGPLGISCPGAASLVEQLTLSVLASVRQTSARPVTAEGTPEADAL